MNTTEALRPRIDLSSCIDGDLCAIVGMSDSGCGEIVYKSRQPVVYAVLAALSQPEVRQPDPATPQAAQAEPVTLDLIRALDIARDAIKANDQWHRDYDDHDGYDGSEIQGHNHGALTCIEAALRDAAAPAQGGQPGDGNG